MNKKEELYIDQIYATADKLTECPRPISEVQVNAGFPSAAEDMLSTKLDLNEYIIKHPAATYFVRVRGESMIEKGIQDKDLLVIDRSIQPSAGKVVIAVIDGEFTVKTLQFRNNKPVLYAANDEYDPIEIKDGMEFSVWGVVTFVIHEA